MIAPLIIYPVARFSFHMQSPITLYPIVFGTTIVWLVVTFLTSPVDRQVLLSFYRKVHPGGLGWRAVAAEAPDVISDSGFGRLFVDWICGVALVYATLFGIGKIIFAEWLPGFIYLAVAFIAAWIIWMDLKRQGLGIRED